MGLKQLLSLDHDMSRPLAVSLRRVAGVGLDVLIFPFGCFMAVPETLMGAWFPIAVLCIQPTLEWALIGLLPGIIQMMIVMELDRRVGGYHASTAGQFSDLICGVEMLLAYLYTERGGRVMGLLLAGIGVANSMNQSLKKVFLRPRPPRQWSAAFQNRGYFLDIRGWTINESKKVVGGYLPDCESFPSGDSAIAGMTAGVMMHLGSRHEYALGCAATVAFARVYFGCHYIIDTIVGVLQGLVSAWLTLQCVDENNSELILIAFGLATYYGGQLAIALLLTPSPPPKNRVATKRK